MSKSRRPSPEAPQESALLKAANKPRTSSTKVTKIVGFTVAPLIGGLAVLGGIASFSTVREMAEPHFGELAWIVPVGMDLGILILLTWDLLMEYLDMPWPVLRWAAWAYIAGTVLVNVAAAHGQLVGSVMHAAMPTLFITVVEGVRHLIRRWVGLASGSRVDRVPTARWLLAPVSSMLLWRRMVLWHITGYRQGLDLEYRHLLAVSELQRQYGRRTWRWRAPLDERLALRKLPTEQVATDVRPRTDLHTNRPSREDELMTVVRRIQDEAERQGEQLTRDKLALRLRELGYRVANKRAAKLVAALRNERSRQDAP